MLAFVYVNQNLRNLNEPDFKEYNPTDLSINVIKDTENIIRLSFSKLLQNTPIIPNFTNFTPTFGGIGALSKYYKYTPTTLGLANFSTGELIGSDSSTSPSTDFKLNVISPQKIESVIASGQSSYITQMDVGTPYNLILTTSKDIDFSYYTNTKFESSDVSMIESASKQLTTTYTPTESDVGTKSLNLTNTKAIDYFIYNLLTNQITITTPLPSFLLNSISFTIPQSWNESNTTSWGLEGKNSDGTWTRLSVSDPANLSVGTFSQSNSNTQKYTTYRMFTSFATAGGSTFRIKTLKMYNNNVLIPGESLSSSTSSTTGYYLQYAEYSDPAGTLDRRYISVADAISKFNSDNGLVSPHELWGSNVNTGRCMTMEITKLS